MEYVSKKTNKKRIVKYILFVIFIAAIVMGGLHFFKKEKIEKQKQVTFCDFTYEDTKHMFQQNGMSIYEVSDYIFYGESLNIFEKDYDMNHKDNLYRKSIQLENLCTKETFTYTLESNADFQIDLKDLTPGTYIFYIIENYEKKRVVFDENIQSEPYYTLTRNHKRKEIRLLANNQLFYDEPTQYPFARMEVKEINDDENITDIILDPYKNLDGTKNTLIDEGKEMLDLAVALKEKLSKHQIHTSIAGIDFATDGKYYGKEGIFNESYKKKATYYFELGMASSTQPLHRGIEIYYSHYASNTLANQILYGLEKQNFLIPISNAYDWKERKEGLLKSVIQEDNIIFDRIHTLRETGSRITGAGQYVTDLKREIPNINPNKGMHALSINVIYQSNEEDINIWKANKDKLIDEIANAILYALQIE